MKSSELTQAIQENPNPDAETKILCQDGDSYDIKVIHHTDNSISLEEVYVEDEEDDV